MRIRRTDHERRPADIARAVEIGAIDPAAPLLSAVRFDKGHVVHYRPRYRRASDARTLCGKPAHRWPVASSARSGLEDICNHCHSKGCSIAGVSCPCGRCRLDRGAA